MDFSNIEIRRIIEGIVILVLSIAVHEFGHAFVAHKLGDPTPESQGRVTLNPIAHADPIGTLLFPVLALVFTGGIGFGWGRPVQVQPRFFSRRFTMRTGHMMVAAAGPGMNVLFAMVISIGHVIALRTGVLDAASPLNHALLYAVMLNFVLAFFNLIPAPPLDGGAVLEGLLPSRWVPGFQRLAVYGPFVLMAVIFIPALNQLFLTPATWLFRVWGGIIGYSV
ncbi:MAG TPA: site-2 protease family protein [Kofleriaceae bacterium]|nr:site-2 protease family protein [Kofleriaceae bacterium]